MQRLLTTMMWVAIAVLGAAAFAVLALSRGEPVNAAWLLTAAVCTYVRRLPFYSKFLAERSSRSTARATPAERFHNGRDFVPTNKWVLFGHHFAAIAGAGPWWGGARGAVGYLPGTLWLVIGVVLGGAVQDFTSSPARCGATAVARPDGEGGDHSVAGMTAMVAVLFNHGDSARGAGADRGERPQGVALGVVTIACTIPSPADGLVDEIVPAGTRG